MPISYSRSDVYYEEQDLSQAIAGVSTSIGAIVGASTRGPVYRRLVSGTDDYILKYGKPDASVSFMGHCALAFLQQSAQLWVRRVVHADATWGGLVLQQTQPDVALGKPLGPQLLIGNVNSNPDVDGVDWQTASGTNNILDNLLYFYAEGPGSYSQDLSIEILSDNLHAVSNLLAQDMTTIGVIIAGVDSTGTLAAGPYTYAVTAVNRVGETSTSTATVTLPGSAAAYLSWTPQSGAIGYSVYRKNQSTNLFEYLETVGAGTPYYVDKGLVVPVAGKQPTNVVLTTSVFTVNVYDNTVSKNNALESFTCSLVPYTDGSGQQLEIGQQINGVSQYIRVLNNVGAFTVPPVVYAIPRTSFAAGDSGSAVTAADINLGWQDFADSEAVEVRILINGGYAIPAVQLYMDQICTTRQDCIAILDVPANKQIAQNAIDYRNIALNLNSNRSAIYSSDVFVQDDYSGQRLYVPPSGHIAGVYAYTDSTTYPWFAPAGMRRGQLRVLGTRMKYTQPERDNLWKAQINYIRNFNGLGRVVWEQRTLQVMQSGFSFVNVRRLMDTISIACRKALLFDEFEPNDDFLRLQIRTMIEDYLRVIQQARGIKKFMVVCDARNNKDYYGDVGQLNVDILITPTLPAEKIRLRGTLTSQGADFSELISSGALN